MAESKEHEFRVQQRALECKRSADEAPNAKGRLTRCMRSLSEVRRGRTLSLTLSSCSLSLALPCVFQPAVPSPPFGGHRSRRRTQSTSSARLHARTSTTVTGAAYCRVKPAPPELHVRAVKWARRAYLQPSLRPTAPESAPPHPPQQLLLSP
eukprot:4302362-Prymnesium_polylepis.1